MPSYAWSSREIMKSILKDAKSIFEPLAVHYIVVRTILYNFAML